MNIVYYYSAVNYETSSSNQFKFVIPLPCFHMCSCCPQGYVCSNRKETSLGLFFMIIHNIKNC
jgi:hypothetical protein